MAFDYARENAHMRGTSVIKKLKGAWTSVYTPIDNLAETVMRGKPRQVLAAIAHGADVNARGGLAALPHLSAPRGTIIPR
jgi:hypothetical protein